MYKVIMLSPYKYFRYMFKRHGLRLFKVTDTGYPRVFALGVCYHSTKEIVVCKVGNYEQRFRHEQGHEHGLEHVPITKVGYLMHPWGFLRGDKY